jgi:hypothetical protein
LIGDVEWVLIEKGEETELVEIYAVKLFVHFEGGVDGLCEELDGVLHPVIWIVLFRLLMHLIY